MTKIEKLKNLFKNTTYEGEKKAAEEESKRTQEEEALKILRYEKETNLVIAKFEKQEMEVLILLILGLVNEAFLPRRKDKVFTNMLFKKTFEDDSK